MSPEETQAVIRPTTKKPWSLKRTKDYYSGKVYNLYRDAVEQKYTSREEASKEIEENVAKIHSATQPEDVKTWYETQFLPLVKHLDIRNKYMKEPEPTEIKQLELTPEEEEQMKGTVLFPASTEFESPIKSEARSVVNRISQQRVRQLRNEIELKNIEQYRSMRREDLVAFCRGIDNEEDKKIMKLLSDNQVDRVKIIKEQEKSYQRILKEFESTKITPVSMLEKIDLNKFFNSDYYLKVKSFEEEIKKLKSKQNEFLSDFLIYVEFQESAIKMYKYEFDQMYTEFAFKYGEIVDRERAEAKFQFEVQQKKLAEIEEQVKETELEEDESRKQLKYEEEQIRKQIEDVRKIKAAIKLSEGEAKERMRAELAETKKEFAILKIKHEQEKELLNLVEEKRQDLQQLYNEKQQELQEYGRLFIEDEFFMRRFLDMKKEQQQKQNNIEEGYMAELADIKDEFESETQKIKYEAPVLKMEEAPIIPPFELPSAPAEQPAPQQTQEQATEAKKAADKLEKGIQTDVLMGKHINMEEIEALIKLYPQFKDQILTSVIGQLVKSNATTK